MQEDERKEIKINKIPEILINFLLLLFYKKKTHYRSYFTIQKEKRERDVVIQF